jgi:hypothetical protein
MTDMILAVREAVQEERDRNVEIAEACQAIGRMDLAPAYIMRGKSSRVVQAELAQLKPKAEPQKRVAFDPAWITQQLQQPPPTRQ